MANKAKEALEQNPGIETEITDRVLSAQEQTDDKTKRKRRHVH